MIRTTLKRAESSGSGLREGKLREVSSGERLVLKRSGEAPIRSSDLDDRTQPRGRKSKDSSSDRVPRRASSISEGNPGSPKSRPKGANTISRINFATLPRGVPYPQAGCLSSRRVYLDSFVDVCKRYSTDLLTPRYF